MIVIGGGPSGCVVATLLASWGHRVRLLTRVPDASRALANSLPPSTRKLLAQVGIAGTVDAIGYRTYGNTVWWGGADGRVEPFSADGTTWGYQVDRARLDPALLEGARAAGVIVEADVRVQQVDWSGDDSLVRYESPGGLRRCRAQVAIDCSGRAGVLAVPLRLRQHVTGGRMQALIGVWSRPDGWFLQNPTHTFIETCNEGWTWSLPVSAMERHVGIMVDGATSRLTRRTVLADTYRAQLALTQRIDRQVRGAALVRVFACDATVYTASAHAGPGYLLVGDSGSTLNPLSSFGIKKALASAWLGAVTAHTCLTSPDRAPGAHAFFSAWSAQTWQVNLARSRDFAIQAREAHQSEFWDSQAGLPVDDALLPIDEGALLGSAEARAALDLLRRHDTFVLTPPGGSTLVSMPIVRGHEIAMEPAVALGPRPRDVTRYLRGVDLVGLSELAPGYHDVPAICEAYAARYGDVHLPALLGALALLIARGLLRLQPRVTASHA